MGGDKDFCGDLGNFRVVQRDEHFTDGLPTVFGEKLSKTSPEDFSGGAVVKNPPANAGDTGSSPGPGRSHMPRSN